MSPNVGAHVRLVGSKRSGSSCLRVRLQRGAFVALLHIAGQCSGFVLNDTRGVNLGGEPCSAASLQNRFVCGIALSRSLCARTVDHALVVLPVSKPRHRFYSSRHVPKAWPIPVVQHRLGEIMPSCMQLYVLRRPWPVESQQAAPSALGQLPCGSRPAEALKRRAEHGTRNTMLCCHVGLAFRRHVAPQCASVPAHAACPAGTMSVCAAD
jgi:hypothetical protein